MLRLLAAISMTITLAAVPGAAARAQDPPGKLADTIVDHMLAGQFTEVVAIFTPEMAKALPAGTLEQLWGNLTSRTGQLRKRETPLTAQLAAATLVAVPLRFEQGAFDVRISVASGHVAGLFIVPGWTPAAYVDPTKFAEIDVQIGRASALPGTLSLPKQGQRVPAVVLVHGSGPGDRDETIVVGPNRPFRDLAGGLASRGIAVLRYDKRTKVYPEQFGPQKRFTAHEETIEDAIAAVALLRTRPEVDPDRIVLIGHSLGATLAPRIAREEPRIAALTMMAPASRPLYELMIEQVEYLAALSGPPDGGALDRIAALKTQAALARTASADDPGPPILNAPPAYWADLNAYDPVDVAKTLTLPMLILQGERDYQVTAKDLERFKAALSGRSNVTIQEFPSLNHLFMGGEGKSRPEEYDRLGHVDGGVVEAIAAFINRLASR